MAEVQFTDIIPADKQAELEAKYGTLRGMKHRTKSLAVLLREPKRGEYKMFRAKAQNDRTKPDAQETLFKQVCVFPETAAAVEALLEQWAGCPEACTPLLEEMVGLTGEDQGKG